MAQREHTRSTRSVPYKRAFPKETVLTSLKTRMLAIKREGGRPGSRGARRPKGGMMMGRASISKRGGGQRPGEGGAARP